MDECLFCNIIKKKIPAKIVYEDEDILAFSDINPVAPKHILFIPKKHISSLNELGESDAILTGKIILKMSEYAKQNNMAEKGYRFVSNIGKEAGQTVFHIHFHLLSGRIFNWPPG